MALQFCSFASGSSGNCYMIKKDDTVLLVDAGISGKRIFAGLEQAGASPEQVAAILITHEHSDHISSLPIVSKKTKESKVYANEKTWNNISRKGPEEKIEFFQTGQDFFIKDIRVRPFAVPHDAAEPVGFSFCLEDKKISIVTDVGHMNDQILREIIDADLLVLEANHQEEVLRMSNYPYELQQRILGKTGHLSNVNAARCLCRLQEGNKKVRRILLGHLSRQNNHPELAKLTVCNMLQDQEIYPGESLKLEVILRDCVSPIYEV